MFQRNRFLALVCLAAGALLGHLAATGSFGLLSIAQAGSQKGTCRGGAQVAAKVGTCMPQDQQPVVIPVEIQVPAGAELGFKG